MGKAGVAMFVDIQAIGCMLTCRTAGRQVVSTGVLPLRRVRPAAKQRSLLPRDDVRTRWEGRPSRGKKVLTMYFEVPYIYSYSSGTVSVCFCLHELNCFECSRPG